ncbi:MAG: hypothetical protein ABW219_13290 [Ilumatobacteraceae bacterium]
MKTRTLLLLAIGCGFVILAAGVVQLLRIAGQDDPPTAAVVGQAVVVGDMTITVDGFTEDGASAVVPIEIGGVDDDDGADAFRLVVPGAALRADPGGAGACGATTVEVAPCELTFDLGSAEGSTRVLLYRRGDQQVRWDLTPP